MTVAEALLERIRRDELRASMQIPSERELMTTLGVSRSTIREAIQGLAMVGVLEIRHGHGVFVLDPAPKVAASIAIAIAQGQTHDLFEARRVVEPGAASLAAGRRTDDDLAALTVILDEHRRAIAAGDSTVAPSVAFHERLAAASANEVLAELVASFGHHLAERGIDLEAVPGFAAWDLAEHEALMIPLGAGDPVAAAARMRGHLDGVIRYQERLDGP
jgi:GntR family transcriptional repressor for pyruvate dehydrogenase complex